MKGDALDPKALVHEAFRMEIGEAECRTIFLDWALSLPEAADTRAALEALLQRYAAKAAHPMTAVLRAGLEQAARTGRRGGRIGRQKG